MPSSPTLEQVAAFVGKVSGVAPTFTIHADTRLEADLGIYGDDGDALLMDLESEFGIVLPRDKEAFRMLFSLDRKQHLFSDELHLLTPVVGLVRRLTGATRSRDLTVGELREVIVKCQNAG
jgi:acyl carrier protein